MLASGPALDGSEVQNGVLTRLASRNIYVTSARVRFSF